MKRREMWMPFVGLAALGQQEQRKDLVGYDDTPVIPGQKWKVHDAARPRVPVVTPGAKPGDPPSDAIVLFDGANLDQFRKPNWKVENGYAQVVPESGDLISKEKFGNAQYHLEWASPQRPDRRGQDRGNSGVILMGYYEIQVLDSFNAPTYPDGQAASIYGQWPPMVNASRPMGEWQTYDIFFEAPVFDGATLVRRPFVTVIHNGVLVHHHQEIVAPVAHRAVAKFTPHAAEESLVLQDHGEPVRYRNIWVRRILGYDTGKA